jgi:prepilin-type N-terminal cleavage/methylation domain-containing protein
MIRMRKVIKPLKNNFKRLGIKNSELRTPNSELQKGFTLIEIIVVIVILSIVSGITIKFLIDSLKIYTMTVNQKTLFDEGKLALERMCRDIRDARAITTPAAGGSGNTIVFQRTNLTSGDGTNETLTFQLTGVNIEKVKTTPASTNVLASNVSAFTVTRGVAATNNENEITLSLTLSLGTGENVTLQTKVYPKNLPTSSTYKNFKEYWREEPSS